ncbi:hypothetical protein EDB89DRAFT_2076489 [Lactarius sanguifluus]|nr:hypothetical protein EDB89DRAFT_2076489 [Lactarius sanguifluus]
MPRARSISRSWAYGNLALAKQPTQRDADPVHNILMDSPPSQSLGIDPVNHDVGVQAATEEGRANHQLPHPLLLTSSASVVIVGTLFVYYFALSNDQCMLWHDQTMTFSSFVFLDLISVIQNCRLGCGLTQNWTLVVIFQTNALLLDNLLLHTCRVFLCAAFGPVAVVNQSEMYAMVMEELA